MNSKKNQTRRKHERRSAFIIVEYSVKEGTFRDILKSIGPNGVFIGTKRTIAPGQAISMTFPLFQFDQMITKTGRVVRDGAHGFAVTFDEPIEELVNDNGQFPEIVHEIDRDDQ